LPIFLDEVCGVDTPAAVSDHGTPTPEDWRGRDEYGRL
jgi:hypothetical protein